MPRKLVLHIDLETNTAQIQNAVGVNHTTHTDNQATRDMIENAQPLPNPQLEIKATVGSTCYWIRVGGTWHRICY